MLRNWARSWQLVQAIHGLHASGRVASKFCPISVNFKSQTLNFTSYKRLTLKAGLLVSLLNLLGLELHLLHSLSRCWSLSRERSLHRSTCSLIDDDSHGG